MKLSKLTLAVATVLSAGASTAAFAIDLYVDTKTKQIYAEPGPHRQLMGSFERVEDRVEKPTQIHTQKHTRLDRDGSFERVEDKVEKPAESAELEKVKEDLALKENEIKALQEHMTEAEQVKVKLDKKGLNFETADKTFKFKLGGRIHADANYHNGDNYRDGAAHVEANDGTEIRRARMRFEGVFYNDWLFRIEPDFADDNVRVKDAFLQYNGVHGLVITGGQQKQNFSRELQESSNDMMFTERSLMNILNAPTVDRAIGLNFESFGKNYVAKAGIYGDSVTPARTTGTEVGNAGDEGWGISSRLVYNPILEKTKLIHLGIAGNYRTPDATGDVAKGKALQLAYETNNMSNLDLVNTSVNDVDNIKMMGLEAAGLYGPFSVGAEYTRSWIDRKQKGTTINSGDSNLELDGWYAEAAWAITGESRGYKEGNFRYLEPAKPFSLKNGGWGAWELATRYSTADLNDGGFHGGELSNVTVALNWYFNSNFRLLANYTRVLDIENADVNSATGQTLTGDNGGLDSFTLRAQVAF